MRKKDKEWLKEELELIHEEITDYENEHYKYIKLNHDYIELDIKYKKLVDMVYSKNTEVIIHDGKLYQVNNVTIEKYENGTETISVDGVKIEKHKGLYDNLSDGISNMYKNVRKLLFGDDDK